MWRYLVLYCVVLLHGMLLHCIILYCELWVVLCCIVCCFVVLQFTVLYHDASCYRLYYVITVYCTIELYCVLHCVVLCCILSHTLKNTANQRPGLPLHILRYATGNMQWVVLHSTIPSLLARSSLLGSIWGLLKSHLRNSSTPANCYEYFRSGTEIFRRFPNTSDDFRKF